jgi:tRNA (mo5U34)-methyltransferase
MDVSQIQAQIDAIPWYHEFDFGSGLASRSQSPDIAFHRRLWRFMEEQLDAIDFRGKTVLDIGCWDGYWSFYAERRGAKRVVAIDDFRQNWAGEEGLLLAKRLLDSQIDVHTRLSVYDLTALEERFDIVLFLGVCYHLFDPFFALAQVRHCCHTDTVVCVEGNEGVGLPANGAIFNSGEPANKFMPSRGHLQQLLEAAYLRLRTACALAPEDMVGAPPRLGWRWRLKMCRAAIRGRRASVRNIAELALGGSERIQRIFLVATPMIEANAAHAYCPPFGLHAYDPRFAGDPQLSGDELVFSGRFPLPAVSGATR